MKKRLFEYIWISLLKKQCEVNKHEWSQVNSNNDFSKDKILLFPFLICVANYEYNRNKLADVFDSFYSNDIGIIDSELSHFIDNIINACAIVSKKTIVHSTLISEIEQLNGQPIRYGKYFEASGLDEMELFDEVRKYLYEELKLTVKSNYQIFPVKIRGIDFVGYRFYHTHILLRKRIKQNCASLLCPEADKLKY